MRKVTKLKSYIVTTLLAIASVNAQITVSPAGGGGSGDALTTNPLSQFAATTSAQLAGVITNETGTGLLVFGTNPTILGLSLGSNRITNVTDPSGAQDAATKNYVDNALAAFQPLESVYAASTANIAGTYLNGAAGIGATFTVTATGALSMDSVSPPLNSRVLLKDQSTGFQNGVYTVTVVGTTGVSPVLTRSLDYNTPAEINAGDLIPVVNGTVNAVTSWLETAVITTIGTDAMVFTKYSANPSSYLAAANNLSDVSNASTSRTNLGLAIGTNVQAFSANLTTWAGITPGAGVGTFLATPSSANLAAAITDETGSGLAVFATSPNLVTPVIGVATGTSLFLNGATAFSSGKFGVRVATDQNFQVWSSGGTVVAIGALNDAGGAFASLDVRSPIIDTGLTASGSAANDFSGSSGTFKTSTGGVTIGPGAVGISGVTTITPPVRTSGVASYLTLNIPADTGQTAATESIGLQIVTASRQWASTGTVPLQRENFFAGPTYTSASASQTFTDVFTLYVTPPVAGSNAIFTRGHTFGIVDATSASSATTGGFVVATTLGTAATSVGIGGGKVNAGTLVTAPALVGTTTTGIANFNQAAQSQVVVSATEYYITRSDLDMPATYSTAIAAGTTMHWRIALTKTAAGTGTFQILLKKGTNGSTADTSIVTQTIGTQTAAADNMECDISLTWTSATAAYWTMIPRQSAATGTGFGLVFPAAAAQFSGTISGQTTTTASDKYGLSVVFTTGTPTFVVNEVAAQAFGVN